MLLIFSAGQYCIYRKGICPLGLESGYVYWNDEDYRNNNKKMAHFLMANITRIPRFTFAVRGVETKLIPL